MYQVGNNKKLCLILSLGEARSSETSVTTARHRFVLKRVYIQIYFLTAGVDADGITFSRILKKYVCWVWAGLLSGSCDHCN